MIFTVKLTPTRNSSTSCIFRLASITRFACPTRILRITISTVSIDAICNFATLTIRIETVSITAFFTKTGILLASHAVNISTNTLAKAINKMIRRGNAGSAVIWGTLTHSASVTTTLKHATTFVISRITYIIPFSALGTSLRKFVAADTVIILTITANFALPSVNIHNVILFAFLAVFTVFTNLAVVITAS